jgi:hypothetical protein
MPVVIERNLARFVDICTVEEAMTVHEWLLAHKTARIDLSACTHLHTSLLQLLLAVRPKLAAPPADAFLAAWVAPLLQAREPGV